MRLGVLNEVRDRERRVALVPESVKKLSAAGWSVRVERGAGAGAFIADRAYTDAGATLAEGPADALADTDLVARIGPPRTPEGGRDEIGLLRRGAVVLGSLFPTRHPRVMRALADAGVTAVSTDCFPRTTRAQAMDTLSSMANIAGYKGVLLAASLLPVYCPMFMTAAGTIFPAKVFVIGAGVAGLQAIATARRLGAAVFATDVRPEVKEQIESVGAKYVGITLAKGAAAGGGYAGELSAEDAAKQRELLAAQCTQSNAVITTALIGGVTAPRLITAEMVRRMRPGSVIVDLAAEGGGNCELSRPGETVEDSGVTIAAPLNLPSTMAADASTLWSRNLTNFILAFTRDKAFTLDMNDDIVKASVITHGGDVVHARTRERLASG
jgi:NAD(P) transhydrogenase subunit alpha